jgi:hypothetical protein
VPVITMAPQNNSHQALPSTPGRLKCLAPFWYKSGMARSASLAKAPPAVNNKTATDQAISFKLFMTAPVTLCLACVGR